MPPRGRRKRASGSSHPRQSLASSLAQTEVSGLSLESNAELPPFFNTTFSTHRVSPLYIGPQPLNRGRLQALSKTLRDLLVGDVVRGVEVGLEGEDGIMSRAGALEAIDMGWETVGAILGLDPQSVDYQTDEITTRRLKAASTREALHISLRYESALCTALLLPRLDDSGDEDAGLEEGDLLFPAKSDHFRALPLLLLRMPTPLNQLRLGTKTLVFNLERWIRVADRVNSTSASSKDVVLTLGFSVPVITDGVQTGDTVDLGLKSIDVIIPAVDLQDFRDAGLQPLKRKGTWEASRSKRRRTDGHLLEEGWEWREKDQGKPASQPFIEALGAYSDEHLALNLFDPRVRVTKVACGGFVMSEARLKLFPPPGDDGERVATTEHMRAVVDCLGDLLDKAVVRL
ncbi:hypothetical protein DL546_003433 [Coniochaeta pulveracea]|uniref:Uncharacterized protein n=1 Tax=Coniochaeta pulveracea TaxID=177199 RepID=A0A420Y3D3_9PEZI|nr:hypothetical protein DL546_003433 [Coniochaeta pulveracea]